MNKFYEEFTRALRSGNSFAVATVVKVHASTPRETGAKMGVFADHATFGTIGGGKLEKLVVDDCISAISAGETLLKRYSLMPEDKGGIGTECGGDVEVFIEPLGQGEKLLLVGGGHIGLAIAGFAKILGLGLEVVDDRVEFANDKRFPGAVVHNTEIHATDFNSIITPRTFVIIVSRSHDIDEQALRAVLECDAPYVGMIGSKRKVHVILDNLAKHGVDPDELAKVFSPIGLDIGSETPEEIALSILGEIVSIKRKGESPLSLKEKKNGKRQ